MRILLGITGGIAAYKSAQIVRTLTELGHEVKVVPTANALRFIGAATLEALSHHSIDSDLYTQVAEVKHIKLAQEADLVIVAPATAAFLARYANGLADDLLLNILLATTAPVVIAPAMHSQMWENQATRANVEKLQERSVHIIEPGVGRLTGDDSGVGRMAEPEDIVSRSLAIVEHNLDLLGKKILIAAGGTREPIDQVRFIGNKSSGRQGIALAECSRNRGAQVTLLSANIDLPLPSGVEVIPVTSHSELEYSLTSRFQDYDAVIMPVAVSDYRVAEVHPGKLHRDSTGSVELQLIPNSDILRNLGQSRRGDLPILVGFAAEVATSPVDLEASAKRKLIAKGCDLIVANNVSGDAVFGSDFNQVLIVDEANTQALEGTKTFVAEAILDRLALLLDS